MLAVGTGLQNAVVRRLAVPDMTTTVLTMTLTGIAADHRSGAPNPALARRLVAVVTMLVGAVAGAELVLHDGAAAGLALATVLLAAVTIAAALTTRRPAAWRPARRPRRARGCRRGVRLGWIGSGTGRRRRKAMKVTIIGAGNMGSAMAARLVDTGHDVTVWDRHPDRHTLLADAGVTVVADLSSAVSHASVVITMVTNGPAVSAVAEQMLDATPEQAVWVQASTVGAEWADRLRALADAHHRQMLDAPVSGGTQPARDGKLSWLVAGPSNAVDAARTGPGGPR